MFLFPYLSISAACIGTKQAVDQFYDRANVAEHIHR